MTQIPFSPGADSPQPQYGMPLPGPIEELRLSAVTAVETAEMLRIASRHIGPLGAVDRDVLGFLPTWDTRVTTVIASLIRRAWAAGLEAGRAELLDEAPAVAAAQRRLADLADVVDGLAGRAEVALGDGADPQDLAERLIEDLQAAVEQYTRGGDRLAKAADQYVRRYRAVLAGDPSTAQRQLAFTVAVESAAALTNSDAELAEAVRAIVAADQEADEAASAALQAVMAEFDAPLSRSYCEGCDEAAADGRDGLCGACRRQSTADQGAEDEATPGPETGRPEEGSANVALLLVCLLAGVVVWVPLLADPWQALVAAAGAVAGFTVLRRAYGICRACGNPGSWRDPLTLFGRPRVHTWHLPNIRESHRASRAATLRPVDQVDAEDALRPEMTQSPDGQGDDHDGEPCEACGARPAHRIPIKAEYAVGRADVLLCGSCLQAVDNARGGAR